MGRMSTFEMEFQNLPFQDLKERVVGFERRIKALEEGHLAVVRRLTGLPIGVEKSETVREEQDDEGGRPFFKTVGAVQETNEQGS